MSGGRLPVIDGKTVIRALTTAGFAVDRIVGSHHVMTFPGDPTRTVTVPVHAGPSSQERYDRSSGKLD